MRLVYHGPPVTKKTSQQIVLRGERPRLLPSAAYRRLIRSAVPELQAQRGAATWPLDHDWRNGRTRRCDLAVRAVFYLAPKQRPDLSGLIEACGDILQEAGVVANDYSIVSWDGSRRVRNSVEPRTEIEVTPQTGGTDECIECKS